MLNGFGASYFVEHIRRLPFCSHVLQSNGRGVLHCFHLFCFIKNPDQPMKKKNPKGPNGFFSLPSALSRDLAMQSLPLLL